MSSLPYSARKNAARIFPTSANLSECSWDVDYTQRSLGNCHTYPEENAWGL